jgi:hypothetical protein
MKNARLIVSLAFVLCIATAALAQAPVDNPVAAKYGDTAYPWANQVKWDTVFNINDYMSVGTTMVDHFNAARDAAFAAGGGVVYFPAGTYTFEDSIYLKSGVVIRGDNPSGVTDAKTDGYAPPTKFVFPQYVPSFSGSGTANTTAFKQIGLVDQQNASNVGIVNVDVNRGEIRFGVFGTGAWQRTDTSAYNAVSSNQRVKNVVVFGLRNNNVALPATGTPNTKQNAWQRYCDSSDANINVQPYKNALVANNRINDNVTDSYFQPGYIVTKGSGTTVLNGTTYSSTVPFAEFSYTDHYGIQTGRIGPHPWSSTPIDDVVSFRPGVAVNDNYVYTTMRVKIFAGGYGATINDNVLRDKNGKTIWCDNGGLKWQTNNSATYENRAIDIAGYNVTVDGNNYQIYRHQIAAGPYYSVDGEGILMQASSGSLAVGETFTNNTGNSYIGLWKTKEIRNILIQGNTITNDMIYVSADVDASNKYPMYNVVVKNNTVSGSITVQSGKYYSTSDGNEVSGNTGGSMAYTTPNVNVFGNTISGSTTTSASTQSNRTPNVAITSPVMWANVGSGATITASASDVDGTISKVDFYTQSTTGNVAMTLLGSDSDGSDGWSLAYAGLTYGGDYMIAAKATDNAGGAWVSDPVYFTAVLGGDCNMDRYTDVIDLGILATNYGKNMGGNWGLGDFNEDGKVDVIDLGILATKYGQNAAGADAGMIPEPLTLSLLGVGMVGLLRRK